MPCVGCVEWLIEIIVCSGGVNLEDLRCAMGVQRHRGPDDQGIAVFRYDGTCREAANIDKLYGESNFDGLFGFNRLSIKDLSIEGHQPMLSMQG